MCGSLPDSGRAAVSMAEMAHQLGGIAELKKRSPQNVVPKYTCHPVLCDTVYRPQGFVTCFLGSSHWLVGRNTALASSIPKKQLSRKRFTEPKCAIDGVTLYNLRIMPSGNTAVVTIKLLHC